MDEELTWLEIDLGAIDHNLNALQQVYGKDKSVLAVVKGNAYGHGMFDVALQAKRSGAEYLAVANADEALTLREKGIVKPIIVLGAVSQEKAKQLAKEGVTMVAFDDNSLEMLKKVAEITRKNPKIHLKVETGLNRLGFQPDRIPDVLRNLRNHSHNLKVEGIYTHLAAVEEIKKSFTNEQLIEFRRALSEIDDPQKQFDYIHTAASAAAVMMPDSRFNAVRPGIMMYGLWPSREVKVWAKKYPETENLELKPAMSWKSTLVHKKKVELGETIGYGCTYTAKQDMTIGVIPMGYYEGYPRHLSNLGFALLRGAVVPVVGRVCMNMTIFDISKVPDAEVGDTVTLLGQDQDKEITAQDLGDWAGTINYEIVSRVPAHIPRKIKNKPQNRK